MSFKRMAALSAVVAALSFAGAPASAQHEGHTMPGMSDTTKKKPAAKPAAKPATTKTKKPVRSAKARTAKKKSSAQVDSTMKKMPSPAAAKPRHDMMSGPLGVPMDRMGSGTTWIPDAVKLPSRHRMLGQWELMAHGFLFGQYDYQSGDRGDDQLGSLNWIMLMATRELAGGHFQARTMLSLDPLTVTPKGYPLLLQTGELYDGQPLHDRQHPHDFFMELGVLYQREITDRIAWSIYAAPSGEPALGPVAFMHRPSAMDNPAAPLSHHWQDATHVSFGVITAGLFARTWQLEGSAFNGREPDEHRWNFDPLKLDSYSGRLTVNPTRSWSLAAGYGYIKSPEELHPDEPVHRITASALHGTRIGTDGQSSTSIVWGVNRHGGDATHSALLENETILDGKNTLFGRAELVQKTGEDLVLGTDPDKRFNVGAVQAGYIRELARVRWATLGLGAAGTVNFVPGSLEDVYGSRNPVGAFVFLRLRPFHLRDNAMQKMQKMKGMEMTDHSH